MVGNAAEEGLLGQLGNPSHSDPARVVALAAFVAGGVGYLAARWIIPELTVSGGIGTGLTICIGVAWILARRVRRRQAARRADVLRATREIQSTESEAQIAAMRASAQANAWGRT